FFTLLGLGWCGWMAFPTSVPPVCTTSGCALFRDGMIGGVSLWWVGGGYFFLMALLSLRGKRVAARLLAMSALAADSVLLFIMFFTAPCLDCLVVAVFIGLVYYSLRGVPDGWFLMPSGPSLLLPVWLGLFLGNSVLAADEMLPRHILGDKNADVSIFFSPSCPACRAALASIGSAAALYPVAEEPDDTDRIIKFASFLRDGLSAGDAAERSIDPAQAVPEYSLFNRAVLTVQLLRNKSALLRQGVRSLPLIRISGMPGFGATSLEKRGGKSEEEGRPPATTGRGETPAAPPAVTQSPSQPPQDGDGRLQPDFLRDLDNLGRCGGDAVGPCSDAPGAR
ncbi:MAG: hypothetical protein LBC14_02835, partial [Desulfovibrio sp.]|nr:hypothetical protein [Desulfovibrio sp.]